MASGEEVSSAARMDTSCLAWPRQIKHLFMCADYSSLLVHPRAFRWVMPKTLTLCMTEEGRKARDSLYCFCSVAGTHSGALILGCDSLVLMQYRAKITPAANKGTPFHRKAKRVLLCAQLLALISHILQYKQDDKKTRISR